MNKFFIILALAGLASVNFQCGKQSSERVEVGPPVQPEIQLQAAILLVDGVYNSELVAPMDVLSHSVFHTAKGIRVFTVGQYDSTITTFEGLRLEPDYAFASDSMPQIDILIVPSAQHSMDTDLLNDDLINFVATTGRQASYVMSLCDGAFVLAKAGLLDLHECTTFPGDIDRFKETYPQLKVHKDVIFVHDRKLITSAGGARSYDPALYLVELLYGKKTADGIAKGLVIDWDVSSVPAVIKR